MTKRNRDEHGQPNSQLSSHCLERPATPTQGDEVSQSGPLTVGSQVTANRLPDREGAPHAATSAVHVDETPNIDDMATDATATALRGELGPFWYLLARAGYTIW